MGNSVGSGLSNCVTRTHCLASAAQRQSPRVERHEGNAACRCSRSDWRSAGVGIEATTRPTAALASRQWPHEDVDPAAYQLRVVPLLRHMGMGPTTSGSAAWLASEPTLLSHAMLTLLKFSTHDCPACQSMVGIDARVTAELGLDFIDVDLRNPETYRKYRSILLRQHPLKSTLSLPCYLLVSDPEGEAQIHGEIVGAMPEQEFRSRLQSLMDDAASVRQSAAPARPDD